MDKFRQIERKRNKPRTITFPKTVEDMPPTSAPSAKIIPFPTNLAEFRRNNSLPKTPPKELENVSPNTKGLVTISICGDSLRDTGINDGDSLICQTEFKRSELVNGKLVIAQLPCLGLAVKFYFEFENKVILRSSNPRYEDLIYSAEMVEVRAIVVQSVKYWS